MTTTVVTPPPPPPQIVTDRFAGPERMSSDRGTCTSLINYCAWGGSGGGRQALVLGMCRCRSRRHCCCCVPEHRRSASCTSLWQLPRWPACRRRDVAGHGGPLGLHSGGKGRPLHPV